ncbi:MAG: sigma-54 dependent transcriptional regulator [Desulfobulbus oligotrophicus]|jgi:DNA-binding NtrC family response regulator|nr:sigma-54 dependent transcriptional regulator [Desulfobulbus oligotrophicus]
MRFLYPPLFRPVIRKRGTFLTWGVTKILIFIGIFLVGTVLTGTIVSVYFVVSTSLDQAYSRNARTRALAQAYEINQLLVAAQNELQYLARMPLSPESIMQHLQAKTAEERSRYKEIAFQGQAVAERFVLVNTGQTIESVAVEQILGAKFDIFSGRTQFVDKPEGHVQISDPMEAVYPSVHVQGEMSGLTMHVIRLTTSVYDADKIFKGRLTLSLDLRKIRDIISLHASRLSPLFLFPQENEHKRGFFFDASGWLLFQSESLEGAHNELSVDTLRVGLQGDIGRPGFSTAFRPAAAHNLFWEMIANVQAGVAGQTLVSGTFLSPNGRDRDLYLSYVPIVFSENAELRRVVGGIGCVDTSFVFMAATHKIASLLAFCLGVGVFLTFMAMYFIGYRITRSVRLLQEEIEQRASGDDVTPLTVAPLFDELHQLQRPINILLTQLKIVRSDKLLQEGIREEDRMRQPVDFEAGILQKPSIDPRSSAMSLYGIVGNGPAINRLRQQIRKAARVLADVLIVGETGTGKELTAEAIHSMGHRADGPFISINCGALDENLLMDALFGHVKGAFTEAHSDRKGAFVAASGGTLHLDEIGNASPRVQQALLRALSVRRIRPLGSDKDVAFDARIIAATNIDLLQCAAAGKFREDLYYRLAVITINTPALRQRKEDIPILIKHFLDENSILTGQEPARISRGALEKLCNYPWPGNIRELRNCITRSLAFMEDDILLAEQVLFADQLPEVAESDRAPRIQDMDGGSCSSSTGCSDPVRATTAEAPRAGKWVSGETPEIVLNARQRKVWPIILRQGEITRSEYQEAVGELISIRTAQYDLRDLVTRGLLEKAGRGPSSRYLLARLSTN